MTLRCLCGSRIYVTHKEPLPIACWRCRRDGSKCGFCNEPTNNTRFCSGSCRHRYAEAMGGGKTLAPRQCGREHCLTIFTPKKADRQYCSRACSNYATREMRKQRKYSPQSQERMAKHYGAPLIAPQVPPMCHGQALAFGSDPHTGRSLQYCHQCGEKPLQSHGVRSYSQRQDFEDEITATVERAKKAPKKAHGKATKWQDNFQVVSKALREKLEREPAA